MMKTRLAQILKKRGISTRELAAAIGCSARSIHNESSKPKSLALRQRITNALRTKVFADVDVTERVWFIRPGVEVEMSNLALARQWRRMFNSLCPGVAIQRGRVVKYVKPLAVTMKNLEGPPRDAGRISAGVITEKKEQDAAAAPVSGTGENAV